MRKNKMSKRIISAITAALMIFAIGCTNKTIDTTDYPTPIGEETGSGETLTNTETEAGEQAGYLSGVSDEDILKPEKNTLKEDGKYTYNPAVIPKWILEEYKDNPKIIRVSKEILIAINNCDTAISCMNQPPLQRLLTGNRPKKRMFTKYCIFLITA